MATSNTARDFPLAPLQSMVWPLAILLMLVLPVAIVIAAIFGSRQPMPGSAVAALSVVLLLMLAALALLKRRRIALEDGVLVVAATFYTARQRSPRSTWRRRGSPASTSTPNSGPG